MKQQPRARRPREPRPNPRIAVYCRVSTEDQAERQTIDAQRDFLARYVDLHALDCHEVYVDDGVSGTLPLAERPAGRRLLDDARAGRFGGVLVYRLDRLGRNLRALLDAHDELDDAGVSIRSATEPFDTATPIGQFLFQLLGSLAELEKATIVERTTLGRDRVARQGKWTNGAVAYGYDTDADGLLVASKRLLPHGQTEADLVRDVFRRIADGATLIAEARRLESLGVPSIHRWPGRPDRILPRWWPSRIHKIVRNPMYKGAYVLHGRNGPVPMPIPALVDDALWERAQAAMTANRDLSSAPGTRTYLLRGLVRCRSILPDGTECGRSYVGAPGSERLVDGSQRLYYHCSGARGHAQMPSRPRCTGRAIPMARLDDRIWADVGAFVRNPGPRLEAARQALLAREPAPADRSAERGRLRREVAGRRAERERAQLLFRKGLADIDETERAVRDCDAAIRAAEALLSGLDAETAAVAASADHLGATALMIGELLPLVAAGDAGDLEARRVVLDRLVREVSVVTETVPRTRRRQKREPKQVRATLVYRFGPVPALGGIPSGLAEGKLPNANQSAVPAITREIALT